MKMLTTIAALSALVSASAAAAGTFSGNWPVTVSHSLRSDGAYCLTLTDDGTLGWTHSGEASLTSQLTGPLPDGTFQLIGHTLVATIEQPGESGQNAGLVFTGRVRNGSIGKGVYEQVYGGGEFDSGEDAFGAKGGC